MSVFGFLPKFVSANRFRRGLTVRADAARDARNYLGAAALYEEALRLAPMRGDLHVQCGHMFKEAEHYTRAEEHYLAAKRLMPDSADLLLQFGHFYKVAGRGAEAVDAYRQALGLRPGWPEATREIASLTGVSASSFAPVDLRNNRIDVEAEAELLAASAEFNVQLDLLPRPAIELLHAHQEGIEIRRLGRAERTNWGTKRTLRGVEAVRGFCISEIAIVEITIFINGLTVHRGPPEGSYALIQESERKELRKHPFNAWIDFSQYAPGPYEIDIGTVDARQRKKTHHESVVVAPPLRESDFPQLDGIVEIDPTDTRSIERQINERPSEIRVARRALLAAPPRAILVQRIDQLGDMVVSVPALRRLRVLFPDAKIVGLLSNANADLAKELALFDEVLVTDFPEDWLQRRRVMPLAKQQELVRLLRPYAFDMAIDMSENGWARRVLLLSGAPFLYGFRAGDDVPGLSVDLEGNTHDRWNGYEVVPHTNKMLGMMEWLGALARSEVNIVERSRPSVEALESVGLREGMRYAVVHDGARLLFSRWPYFNTLAEMILRETELHVVMLRDDQSAGSGLTEELASSARFTLMPPRLTFDAFDALLANCEVFVGNDSGPKHLASLRGAEVVSIHMARTNWNEWGQESSGYIVTRKVPCAGCMIHYDAEECGAAFVCLRNIKPAEVMEAIKKVLAGSKAVSAESPRQSTPVNEMASGSGRAAVPGQG